MTELALRSDVPGTLNDQMELARVLSASQLLPTHLAGKPANVLSIMFAAQALGVPLWTAIQGMQVINGKVGINADLARALILNRGHSFRVVESTTERATVEVVRKGEEYVHSATFTIEDARTAHLAGKGAWVTYPLAMLVARATTLVARQACADVLAGMSYTPEELGADVDEEGRITEGSGAAPARDFPAPNPECDKCHFFHRADGVCPVGEPGPTRTKNGGVRKDSLTRAERDEQKRVAAELEALAPDNEPGRIQRSVASPDPADPWAQGVAGPALDLPEMASEKWCRDWLDQLTACPTPQMVHVQETAAGKARRDSVITEPQYRLLLKASAARKEQIAQEEQTAASA